MIYRARHCQKVRPEEVHERGLRRMRHFVGARLHRRLFFAMGLAIFTTILSAVLVLHFSSGDQRRQLKEIESFLSINANVYRSGK